MCWSHERQSPKVRRTQSLTSHTSPGSPVLSFSSPFLFHYFTHLTLSLSLTHSVFSAFPWLSAVGEKPDDLHFPSFSFPRLFWGIWAVGNITDWWMVGIFYTCKLPGIMERHTHTCSPVSHAEWMDWFVLLGCVGYMYSLMRQIRDTNILGTCSKLLLAKGSPTSVCTGYWMYC